MLRRLWPLLARWLHFTNKEHMPSSSQFRVCREVAWCEPAVDLYVASCNANRCWWDAVSLMFHFRWHLSIPSIRWGADGEHLGVSLALLPVTPCGADTAVPEEHFAWVRTGDWEQSALQVSHLLLYTFCCPLSPPVLQHRHMNCQPASSLNLSF